MPATCPIAAAPAPVGVVGKTFLEALVELKRDYNLLVVGIQSGEDILHTNPPGTYQIRAIDRLYIIAAERPSFAPVRQAGQSAL